MEFRECCDAIEWLQHRCPISSPDSLCSNDSDDDDGGYDDAFDDDDAAAAGYYY